MRLFLVVVFIMMLSCDRIYEQRQRDIEQMNMVEYKKMESELVNILLRDDVNSDTVKVELENNFLVYTINDNGVIVRIRIYKGKWL